jgi:probable phosphoglycerate mutase
VELFLVRHGQPDWTPDRIARNDPLLTELGRNQALRVAHRLSSLDRVDEVWASSMTRAVETSVPISAQLHRETEVYDWLQEINNPPEWEGSPAEEMDHYFETMNLRTMDEMWDGLGPNGESFRDFHERVVTGLIDTLDSHGIHRAEPDSRHLWTVDDPAKRVVIVAHAGTNAVVLGHLLGLEPVPWEWERFRQPHTGVSHLSMTRVSTAWAFSLRQLGDVTHLHPGMVTI